MPEGSQYIDPDGIAVLQPAFQITTEKRNRFSIDRTGLHTIYTDTERYVASILDHFFPEDIPELERPAIIELRREWELFSASLVAELRKQPQSDRARELNLAIQRHEETHRIQEIRHSDTTLQGHLTYMIMLLQDEQGSVPDVYYTLKSSIHVLSELQAMFTEIQGGANLNTDALAIRAYQSLVSTSRLEGPQFSTSLLYLDIILDVMDGRQSIASIPGGKEHTVASLFLLFGDEIFSQKNLLRLPDGVERGGARNGQFLQRLERKIHDAIEKPHEHCSIILTTDFQKKIDQKLVDLYAQIP